METSTNKTLLVVAAHPDDEILGCGGTVARLVGEGWRAYALILGEGITSRDETRDPAAHAAELQALKDRAREANAALGVADVFIYSFPDNRFDTVALLDIVKVVEKVKREVRPSLVFTHYGDDLNKDHRIVYEAVVTAIRPLEGETVRTVYAFETLSSTEWQCPPSFSPDTCFDIGATIGHKTDAMRKYEGELRRYPHPRSVEGIEYQARFRGLAAGLTHAEAFRTVRDIR